MTTTVTAADNAPKVLISQSGRKGDPGTNGTNGDGFNQVRKSLLDNPLCHLFKTNKLVDTSAPTSTDSDVTWNRSTSATYVDRYGIVRTAAVDTIREEKDGFLIEESGTNIATYSEQFDNAAWLKQGAIPVTANATTAPDGTMTADNLDDTSAAAAGAAIQNFTLLASTTYTYSVFLKQGTAAKTSISSNNSGGFITLTIDWATFALSGNSLSTSKLEIIGNGWVRLSITITTVGAAGGDIRIYPADSDSGNVAVGSVYAWGAQIEQSLAATSYIPTVATPVTRIADTALLPVLNNVVTKEFSIFGILSDISSTTTGNKFIFRMPVVAGYLALFYNPNNNERLFFRYDDDSAAVQLTVLSTGNIKYFVVTVDESNVTININGTESSASKITDPSLVLANNVVFFGQGGSALSNGNIKDFRIYDFALNANEIEYLLP